MHKIEMSVQPIIGEHTIDEIIVHPLTFLELTSVWNDARNDPKPDTALQRNRIRHQTHFMSGKERVIPTDQNIRELPIGIAKDIIAALDIEQGEPGKLLPDTGDGVGAALVYQLGKPIEMKSGDGKFEIKELEFFAKTYGDIEEVLAAENEMDRVLVLLRTLAKPLGVASLKTLPLWAVDRITVADGVTIMRKVSPNF